MPAATGKATQGDGREGGKEGWKWVGVNRKVMGWGGWPRKGPVWW